MSRRILSLLAHPDDAEFLCAGVLIRLRDLGWDIDIASMTPGDCGSRDRSAAEIARVRLEEARRAAAKIEGRYHCLNARDLLIAYDAPTLRRTVEAIRSVNPDIVITHSPQDYLPDHEFTSLLARAACFAAPAPNFSTGELPCSPPTERLPHLYYAAPIGGTDIFGAPVPCSVVFDISEVIDRKTELLACHASQREWLRAQHGIDEYVETMRRWAAETGRRTGVEYGEGFRQHRGHPYPHNDLLAELLGGHPA
jgi:LmbE family N-acetylglucosaminyl deacetylase